MLEIHFPLFLEFGRNARSAPAGVLGVGACGGFRRRDHLQYCTVPCSVPLLRTTTPYYYFGFFAAAERGEGRGELGSQHMCVAVLEPHLWLPFYRPVAAALPNVYCSVAASRASCGFHARPRFFYPSSLTNDENEVVDDAVGENKESLPVGRKSCCLSPTSYFFFFLLSSR